MARTFSLMLAVAVLLIAGWLVSPAVADNHFMGQSAGFVSGIRKLVHSHVEPLRVIQVDLDYIYDPDPAQQEHNLDSLVARVQKMGINAVFLQAFADPQGTGLASALYFPNRSLPTRADLFGHAVERLKQDAHVKVFGWLPVLSFDFGDRVSPVLAWDPATGQAGRDPKAYRRASPFDSAAREKILAIYEDMARQAPIDGILFHDDAMLSDFEDAGPAALAAYQAAGFSASIPSIRADAGAMKKWTDFKAGTLIKFTQDLAAGARRYRSPLLTARNIYAPVVLDANSRAWFAQDYDRFLQAYDYTAVEAMPQMENVPGPETNAWMQRLAAAASERPDGLRRTIFELQAVDWHKEASGDRAVPTETLAGEMRLLVSRGALNLGYYPDDFATNTPDIDRLHKDFSLQPRSYLP